MTGRVTEHDSLDSLLEAIDDNHTPLKGVHDETIYGVLHEVRGQSWFGKCNALEAALVAHGWTAPAGHPLASPSLRPTEGTGDGDEQPLDTPPGLWRGALTLSGSVAELDRLCIYWERGGQSDRDAGHRHKGALRQCIQALQVDLPIHVAVENYRRTMERIVADEAASAKGAAARLMRIEALANALENQARFADHEYASWLRDTARRIKGALALNPEPPAP